MSRSRLFQATLTFALISLALLWVVPAAGALRCQPGAGQEWVWPLEPRPQVVAAFQPPDKPWGSGHRGIDLLGTPGQHVLAIGAGKVTYAGVLAGRGVVVVDHGDLRSTYEPVDATLPVGRRVAAGDVIGALRSVRSHCAPRICLHLGVKRGATYLDPLSLLGPRDVRLKPVGEGAVSGVGSPSALAGPDARGMPVDAAAGRGSTRSGSAALDASSTITWRVGLGGAAALLAGVIGGLTIRPDLSKWRDRARS
ncbi:MAG: murein hydrolase activator EnvC family protein [Nocardioidaceae bacterium]